MEALYSKLYDKYTKLKARKYSEMEQINLDQEEKFKTCVSAADEVIGYLMSEKDRLRAQISDLSRELVSIRSTKDEELEKYEKMLMQEHQKNNELSGEIERLQRREIHFSSRCGVSAIGQVSGSPLSSERTSNSTIRKRKRNFMHEKEVSVGGQDEHASLGESENALSGATCNVIQFYLCTDNSNKRVQPKCCRPRHGSSDASDSTMCMFQELMDCLVDLKFSIVNQIDDILITAVHESSGYSFSLRWVKNKVGEEEFMYRVSSLGTFERVAPEWMREVMLFSKSMCRIFFKRISGIVKLHD